MNKQQFSTQRALEDQTFIVVFIAQTLLNSNNNAFSFKIFSPVK